jgi:hypothetical protein
MNALLEAVAAPLGEIKRAMEALAARDLCPRVRAPAAKVTGKRADLGLTRLSAPPPATSWATPRRRPPGEVCPVHACYILLPAYLPCRPCSHPLMGGDRPPGVTTATLAAAFRQGSS